MVRIEDRRERDIASIIGNTEGGLVIPLSYALATLSLGIGLVLTYVYRERSHRIHRHLRA